MPTSSTPHESKSPAPGYVVLAAYRPDAALFERQLRSIQSQTIAEFRCLITADGEPDMVARVVKAAVGDDDRFTVLGYEDRLGFYGNFERGLAAVPGDAAWVALSDQDDYWYQDKLATLLPHLAAVAAVSGQARVVRYPSDEVVAASTNRRSVPISSYMLDNQFTGGQMVLRREVLDTALPFPRLRTAAEVHDHWLAVVAGLLGGAKVIPDVLQDYVQHSSNVIGEAIGGFNPARSIRNARRLALKYEGDDSARAIASVTFRVGVGWREVMATALQDRLSPSAQLQQLVSLYGPDRALGKTFVSILGAVLRRESSFRSAAEYFAGWVLGCLFGLRRAFSRALAVGKPPESPARS